MRRFIPSLAACLAVAFLAGCVAPSAAGRRALVGAISGQEYCPAPGLLSGRGKIAVVFAPTCARRPPTFWRLVGANGPGLAHPVTDAGAAQFESERADAYGLIFEFPRKHRELHPHAKIPEPRMVTVMEEQSLTVTITYQ